MTGNAGNAADAAATPVPTVALVDPSRTANQVLNLIDNIIGDTGPMGEMRALWVTATQNTTTACQNTAPSFPPLFELAEAEAQASPVLAEAVAAVNESLDTLSLQAGEFSLACGQGRISSIAPERIRTIDAIRQTLLDVQADLTAISTA
jgi:hypothetical protein